MIIDILLIEDSEAISKSISFDLQRNGYTLYSAHTITEGLSILSDNTIGLIIADIDLKSSKIIDFTSSILDDNRYNLIPLIMLINEEEKVSGKIIPGIEEWMIKPFSTHKLLKTVKKFL